MATRRRRSIDFRDYRSALYRDGELSIGAYARAQRRRQVLIALAGLALVGGAVWLHFALREPTDVTSPGAPPVYVQCIVADCGYRGVAHLKPGQGFPVKCPKCGQNSCQPVWECRDCGEQFLPRGRPAEVKCPRCGSRRVGIAEGPREQAGGP